MNRLKNKVAVITGGSSGMGLATAKLFASQGAKVVIVGRKQDKLNEAESKVSQCGEVLAIQCDVTSMGDLESMYQQAQDKFGKIDILFANAGMGVFIPTKKVSESDFDKITSVNFKGVFFTVQKALDYFNDNGSIILNASWIGHRGLAGGAIYGATKAAVMSLAQSFSIDLYQEKKIRVNSISPGAISTPMVKDSGLSESEIEQMRQQIPIKRWGDPEEIAKTVLFLASDDSSYIVGQDIPVDGGMLTLHG